MAKVVQYILDIESGKAEKGLKDVSKQASKTEKNLDKTRKSGVKMAGAIKSGATAMAAGVAVAAAGVASLAVAFKAAAETAHELTKEVVDSVNRLNDLSARSGVAATTIQAVSTAFAASGQEAAKADGFISKFPKIYADLAIEGTRAADAAKQLGISVKNNDGTMKSADSLLIEMTESLQGMEDDTQRAAAAFMLFGRSAGDFLQAFGKTSSMQAFLKLTDQFGVAVGEDASKAASQFQVQLAVIDVVVSGLKQKFVDATGGVGIFNSGLRKTIIVAVALQEMIDANMQAFQALGKGLADLSVGIFEGFTAITSAFVSFLNGIIQRTLVTWTALALAANKIGVLSDEGFQAFAGASGGAMQVSQAAADIGSAFADLEFEETESAKEALSALDEILAGLDGTLEKTTFDFDKLTSSLDSAGTAAAETEIAFFNVSDADKKRVQQFIDASNLIASTADQFNKLSMTDLEVELANLDKLFNEITVAMETVKESGGDTALAEKVLAQIRQEQTRLTNEAADSMQVMNASLSDMINAAAQAVNALSSPEGLIRSLPAMLKSFEPLLNAASGIAGRAAGSLTEFAAGASSKVVAGVAGRAAGAVGSVAGGAASLAAGAAAAVPIVGAIGALTVALARIGEVNVKDLDAQFDLFIENLKKGLDNLPEIISSVLPQFIAQLARVLAVDLPVLLAFTLPIALGKALIMLIPHLINEVVLLIADIFKGIVRTIQGIQTFIQTITTKEGWKMIGESIAQAIKDQLAFSKNFLQEAFAMRSGGRFIPSARGGIRFTGAEEGLAMLHRGEFVVPETNTMPQAVDRRLKRELGSGINLTINADIVEGSAIDELVRKIEERFGSLGASTSTLFGGI